MPSDNREHRNEDVAPRERDYTGESQKPEVDGEDRRLDRQYTGNSVNARTDELDREGHEDTGQLRRKHGEGDPGHKPDGA